MAVRLESEYRLDLSPLERVGIVMAGIFVALLMLVVVGLIALVPVA